MKERKESTAFSRLPPEIYYKDASRQVHAVIHRYRVLQLADNQQVVERQMAVDKKNVFDSSCSFMSRHLVISCLMSMFLRANAAHRVQLYRRK